MNTARSILSPRSTTRLRPIYEPLSERIAFQCFVIDQILVRSNNESLQKRTMLLTIRPLCTSPYKKNDADQDPAAVQSVSVNTTLHNSTQKTRSNTHSLNNWQCALLCWLTVTSMKGVAIVSKYMYIRRMTYHVPYDFHLIPFSGIDKLHATFKRTTKEQRNKTYVDWNWTTI